MADDLTRLIEEAAERGAERALAAQRERRVAYTVAEAAAALGCSPDTIRRLIGQGHLSLVPHMGRRQLIPVAALEAFAISATTT